MHPHAKPACLLLALCLILCAGPSLAADPVGVAARIKGEVSAADAAGRRALSPGGHVFTGDEIATGPDARLEIEMRDGTVLTLGADTVFRLDAYELTADGGLADAAMSLVRGAFRAVTGKLLKLGGARFEVRTPLATIGARGTDFWGGFLSADELSVLLVSGGGVEVSNAFGRRVLATPGQGLTVRRPAPDSRVPGLAPDEPMAWTREEIGRAVSTVAF